MKRKKLIQYGIGLGALALISGAYALGHYVGKKEQKKIENKFFQEYDKNIDGYINESEIIESELESKLKIQTDFLIKNNLITDEGCLVFPPIPEYDNKYEPSGLPRNEGFEGQYIPGISYGSPVERHFVTPIK